MRIQRIVVLMAIAALIVVASGSQPGQSRAGSLEFVGSAGQEGCPEDSFEDNDEQPEAAFVTLPFGESDLRSCYDDNDYFAFAVEAGQVIHINVLFSHAAGNLDVFLHTPLGSLVGGSTGDDDNEEVNHLATMDGSYALHVGLNEDPAHPGTVYRLEITVDGASTPTSTPPPTIAPTATRTPTPTKAAGDINDDGRTNAIDAALVLQHSAGLLDSLPNAASADVNNDDRINALDAALILQHAAGLIVL